MNCQRTWSAWRRKRGRKKKRVNQSFVISFLNREIASLASLSKKRRCSEARTQNMLKNSREQFMRRTSWTAIPDGDLLLIADAVVEMIEGCWHTVYLMLVRSTESNAAIILPPHFAVGTETEPGWRSAMDTLPTSIMSRICAIVCDGHKGLVQEGVWRNWVIQRCHFHLLARIQSRRSLFRIGRNKEEANKIFKHVRVVLYSLNEVEVSLSLNVLEEIGWISTSSEIRTVLSGFVNKYRDYRSYLYYPELNLPITNNTAESLASSIADLKTRMRGFPTLRSFKQWIIALLKFKKSIACNGFYQQNKKG